MISARQSATIAAIACAGLAASGAWASSVPVVLDYVIHNGGTLDNDSSTEGVTVSGVEGWISDISVTVEGVETTYSEDLGFTLNGHGEANPRVLMADQGGSGDWTGQTIIFNDAAGQSITAVTAGTGGTYRPQDSLDTFIGRSANTDWTFGFIDDLAMDPSTIQRALLNLTVSPFTNNGVFALHQGATISSSGDAEDFAKVVGLDGLVSEISVAIDGVTATWSADLEFILTSPSGKSVTLMSDLFDGADWTGESLVFQDAAATSIENGGAGVGGTFRPQEAFSAFDGEDPNGNWSLMFRDLVNGDTSSISGATLYVTTESATVVPVPAALPMALGGLALLGGLSARRRRNTHQKTA